MENNIRARSFSYLGLFLATLATLLYEMLLTRIFSVTMWYHFAFMAVSIAMFGMTLGALLVYLRPRRFRPERVKLEMAKSTLAFSASVVISFLIHIEVPFVPNLTTAGFVTLGFHYIIISIPFIFSGICVTLMLTKFPKQVSGLYAVDLLGAALGCWMMIGLLKILCVDILIDMFQILKIIIILPMFLGIQYL